MIYSEFQGSQGCKEKNLSGENEREGRERRGVGGEGKRRREERGREGKEEDRGGGRERRRGGRGEGKERKEKGKERNTTLLLKLKETYGCLN